MTVSVDLKVLWELLVRTGESVRELAEAVRTSRRLQDEARALRAELIQVQAARPKARAVPPGAWPAAPPNATTPAEGEPRDWATRDEPTAGAFPFPRRPDPESA
jgi:hypothetical protein